MLESYKDTILSATGKALATSGPQGLNVVPVSVLKIEDDKIVLFDFFMNKSVANIKSNGQIALTCWQGLSGLQIKGDALYINTGLSYETQKEEMKRQFPDRNLNGLIVITPKEIYDISAGDKAGMLLAS